MTTLCHLCQLCRKPVFHQFSNDELICIQHLKTGEQTVRTRSLVLLPGATQTAPRTVLAGWAFIYRTLTDGERQILDSRLPGDLIGIQALVSNTSEYGVQALPPLKLCVFAGL